MNYTTFNRGSEWRRWDLHLHTPGTKKNDQFSGVNNQEKWNTFITDINASTENVSVVGITDYFCIENYFKFKGLCEKGTITKKFDLLIPNIELRITPVTSSATPINIHCLFNPDIDDEIDSRFLSKLKFRFDGSDYSAQRTELMRLGRAFRNQLHLADDVAHIAGVEQYVISMSDLQSVFESDQKLRENTIVVVSNKSSDGVSGITKHADFFINQQTSQLDAARWNIYQFSDAIFSANNNDILYFTGYGPDSKDEVIQKCKSLMPCLHGCDAHDNKKIFKPTDNKYCWIKADPTFKGLKQTLYEPIDRVKVQSLKPDTKNDRNLISEIRFKSSNHLFGNKTIYLNENLNAIIGGKSSGKSLLLHSAAKSIDPVQVETTSKKLGFEGYNFSNGYNIEVVWKNNDIDILSDEKAENKNHKITFIPQLYINHLVERNNKEELNTLIKNILAQDIFFKTFYDTTTNAIYKVNEEIELHLASYLQTRIKLSEITQQIRDVGKSDAIAKNVLELQKSILAAQTLSNLDATEYQLYNSLLERKSEIEKKLSENVEKSKVAQTLVAELKFAKANLFGRYGSSQALITRGTLDKIFDQLSEGNDDIIKIRKEAEKDFEVLIDGVEGKIKTLTIETQNHSLQSELNQIKSQLEPYLKKLAGQEELKKLSANLSAEIAKRDKCLLLENQYKTYIEDYNAARNQKVFLLKQRIKLYEDLVDYINKNKSDIGGEISLKASPVYRLEDFELYEQTNKNSIPNDHFVNSLISEDQVNYNEIPKLYSNILRINGDKLIVDEKRNIPLRTKVSLEDVLRGLLADKIEIDYTVSYRGDDLLSMSPGKKGTVLLILFLEISSSEHPILIDQPEDNLDNRTIYDLLCKMIKQKKKQRQIIIVSHNANLVVGTDAENIIVANQEGQGTLIKNDTSRFEYINGSIEHSFLKVSANSNVLECQGIKEHVCDILEGGNEAFKQREMKYAIK